MTTSDFEQEHRQHIRELEQHLNSLRRKISELLMCRGHLRCDLRELPLRQDRSG